jgi:hypothetical protein
MAQAQSLLHLVVFAQNADFQEFNMSNMFNNPTESNSAIIFRLIFSIFSRVSQVGSTPSQGEMELGPEPPETHRLLQDV